MINVKEERVRRGLSQQELAHAAGIERAQLSRIEAGKVQPHAQTLHKLKSVIDDFRTNDVRTCRVHDLDDDSVTYFDNKFLHGRTNLYKVKIHSESNSPELHKGDTAFIDADQVDGDDQKKDTLGFHEEIFSKRRKNRQKRNKTYGPSGSYRQRFLKSLLQILQTD